MKKGTPNERMQLTGRQLLVPWHEVVAAGPQLIRVVRRLCRSGATTMTSAGDNHCPACRAALWAPEDETIGQRSCPRCGAELWALVGAGGPMFFLRRPGESE